MAPTTGIASCPTGFIQSTPKQCKAPDIAQESRILCLFFLLFFFLIKVPNPEIILPAKRQPPTQQDVFRPTISNPISYCLQTASSNVKHKKKTQTQTTVVHDPHDWPFARLAPKQNHQNVVLSFGLFKSAAVRPESAQLSKPPTGCIYPLTGSDTLCRKKKKKASSSSTISSPSPVRRPAIRNRRYSKY